MTTIDDLVKDIMKVPYSKSYARERIAEAKAEWSATTINDTEIEKLRENVFGGKTLRENLRDIIARHSTGYSYDELKNVIAIGDDMLEDDEVESVDRTVNLLAHLMTAHAQRVKAAEVSRTLDFLNDPVVTKLGLVRILRNRIAHLKATQPEGGGEL